MQLKASAPGSFMLLGEYAVLYGKPALLCAVDKRISVTLTPRLDKKIEIYSSTHGCFSTSITQIQIEKPFQFVLGALKQYCNQLKQGCDIHIETEFSDKVGLGSSAAVTVATLAALATWLDKDVSPITLVRHGRQVVRDVQGVGSGADIAASVYGGIISYSAQPLRVEKFNITYPLTALYAGFKTPTVDAINHVQRYFAAYPNLFRDICHCIGQCATEGIDFVRKADWKKLGDIMNTQQGLLESLGVGLPLLRELIDKLREQENIIGAKISGSGLGDCVIGLGELPEQYAITSQHQGIQHIPVTMTLQGVQCEKI